MSKQTTKPPILPRPKDQPDLELHEQILEKSLQALKTDDDVSLYDLMEGYVVPYVDARCAVMQDSIDALTAEVADISEANDSAEELLTRSAALLIEAGSVLDEVKDEALKPRIELFRSHYLEWAADMDASLSGDEDQDEEDADQPSDDQTSEEQPGEERTEKEGA